MHLHNTPDVILNPYRFQSVASGDFEFEVRTTGTSEVFTLPLQNATTNCTIDWGDGATSEITTYNDGDLAHTYTDIGTY